ncbi:MAG: hypothetical protein DMD85_18200 [Candidatus Rokuibacteriota bacterium]|nr:MAG: hypothetical protein DMD85_18200 [Candidatus Rokubacteria bacterium]
MRIVDLSFPIRPHFRWKVEPKLSKSHAAGDVFQSTVLTVACHAYTHVDAPVHFLPGDRDIASMPVDQWIGDAAVVDLSHLGDNGEVTAAELEQHAGHVRRGGRESRRLRLSARLHGAHVDLRAEREAHARAVHDAPRVLPRRHYRGRVPDESRSNRRAAVPIHGAAAAHRRRRRLAGARDRARGLIEHGGPRNGPQAPRARRASAKPWRSSITRSAARVSSAGCPAPG